MEDFNSKYTGEQVEELLDQVASGGTGGGESDIYIWEFNGSLEDGASGTIEREVLEKLAEAKSLWLRREESYTVCNYHVGDSSSLFMLFTTIQQDIMSNCAITIDGETLQYNVAVYEISIQDAIFDLEDIRSGAEKGATALQEIPSDVVRSSNIKTINGKSILGSGNIEISGGGSSGGSKEFVEVTPNRDPLGYYGDLGAIVPNNVYVFTRPINGLGVAAFEYSDSKGDEYSIMFTASEDNIPIRMPFGANIYWANGVIPIINSGDLCELSLLRIGSNIKAVLTTFKAV